MDHFFRSSQEEQLTSKGITETRGGHGKQWVRKLLQGEEPKANQRTFPIFGIDGLGNTFPA